MTTTALEQQSYGASWLMVAAIILIGVGAVLKQPDVATVLIILGLIAGAIAIVASRSATLRAFGRRAVTMVMVVGIVVQAIVFTVQSTLPLPLPLVGLGLAALGVYAIVSDGRWRTMQMTVVVIGHFILMAGMLAISGPPDIDVYDFQQLASEAMLNGENPFAIRFPNTAGLDSPYYSPEVVDGDQLTFGFIYLPLSLLLALPGYALLGDYRYAALAALSLAALLIVFARPGRLAAGASLLVLFAPITQFVLYWGWSDTFAALPFVAVALLARRASAATPIGVGLLIALKQYLPILLILAVFVLGRARERVGWPAFVGVSVLTATLTVVPFFVWDPGAFIYSTVTMHVLQPFRDDSLSVPALLVRAGFAQLPSAIGFVVAGLAVVLVAWRAPPTAASFCAGSAVVLTAFFLFSKQAFLNYYFLPLLALAVALSMAEDDR